MLNVSEEKKEMLDKNSFLSCVNFLKVILETKKYCQEKLSEYNVNTHQGTK